ncbi:MAG: response regulator [Lachnospiraceae bacterium]|nr:response regulator [Lachnospiraceae bacterium]
METQEKKKSSMAQFLIGSFIVLLMSSIGGFAYLGYYMNRVSGEAFDKVGNLYMEGINDHITAHFRTLIDLKLEQLEAVVEVVPSDTDDMEELYDELVNRANVRNFNYLALCSEDDQLEMLYGKQIMLTYPEPFYESLEKHEKKVAIGSDDSGNEVVLFGVNAQYPMRDGRESMALVAAVPIDYISVMMESTRENELIYTHIIRQDGNFIISDASVSVEYENYYESLYEKYRDDDVEKIDGYIEKFSDALAKNEDFFIVMDFADDNQQIYCTRLPYSEWHLVSILPFGVLNETVESMSRSRVIATASVCAIILIILLIIFYAYYDMTRHQMEELEAARERALEATKAKSTFLSNMSHDIRTPMNAIVGMTAIAMTHIDDKERVWNCLKKITLSSKHLLGLINDVLDMSKIENGKLSLTAERISLQEVVEGVVGIVQTQVKGKEQNFNVHIDNIVVENIYCDSVRLVQVLLNLLSNAVKYTQEGGTIWFSMYQEEAAEKGDDYIRTHILVKDNGIGMTPEFLEHVFDSYARADSKRVHKTEGAGLGMAITKHIVEAMDGTITVKSELNKGTEFHVTLDLERAKTEEIDMQLPAWKVLVVDDDEMLCRTAVDSLCSIGIEAEWAMSGERALQMVTEHHEAQNDYQIIMIDWKLPGIDGIMLAKQIRKIVPPDVVIILISAYDRSELKEQASEAGINGFITKPLFKSTLYYGLKKYMEGKDEQEEKEKDTGLSGCRILVAEDNELNWEILSDLFSDEGVELDWAENGKICLEKFEKSPSGYYNAILMDVRMPVMNGREATEAIRASDHQNAQTIPIIAMTADAFSEDIKRCLDSGMNAHTSKPINMDELISLLKKYIVS